MGQPEFPAARAVHQPALPPTWLMSQLTVWAACFPSSRALKSHAGVVNNQVPTSSPLVPPGNRVPHLPRLPSSTPLTPRCDKDSQFYPVCTAQGPQRHPGRQRLSGLG